MIPARRLFLLLGLVALLLVVAAAVPGAGALALGADGALLACAAIDALRARRIRIEAVRTWPAMVAQGQTETLLLELRATRTRFGARPRLRALTVALREGLHPALAARPFRATLTLDTADLAVEVPLEPTRRGDHAAGPLSVRVLGPWGLAWAQREILGGEPVRVYPRVRWGGRVGKLLALAQRRELGALAVERRGVGGELYGLRPYLAGDPLGRIHWKASARAGELVTREDAWERGAPLLIVLDCARAMATQSGRLSKLDFALAASLALCRVAASRGDRVGVIAFSDRVLRHVQLRSSKSGLALAYRQLYDLEAELVEPAWDQIGEAVQRSGMPRATVVLFSSVVDLASAEVLRGVLLELRRRHRPLLINLEDPVIRELAEQPPASPAAAFAKAASLKILLRNRRLAEQLRRGGVRAISAPADRLALETLEAYLETLGGSRASGRRRRAS
jgi:uncharacterized protein (DUF58 family)